MCGIIGVASKVVIANRTWLAAGRDAMVHRGPDDAGEWWSSNGSVGLAHRRLAIIDLSPGSHQPMHNVASGMTIVFNGEIYNFQELRSQLVSKGYAFRSQSDTEVLLAAYCHWGTDCLSHLNGMFAFAIHDAKRQALFIARDRAGEKPLFYHHYNGELRFASELKALLADPALPRRIDPEALDCYLAMGFIPGARCILQGFSKLPPASALLFDLHTGQSKLWNYWQLPQQIPASESTDETALLDELESLLEDSVRKQLVADVPVGVLLSGGVDSSLITAMAKRSSSNLRTFTIRFPGHGKHDETEHASLIARHFQTEHIELDGRSASADLLHRLARQFDEPIADSSMIPTYFVSYLARQHCTVVLGGDGGDELFGGYPRYRRLLWMRDFLGRIPGPLRRGVALAAGNLLPIGVTGRNYLQAVGADLDTSLGNIAYCFDDATRKRLLKNQSAWSLVAESVFRGLVPRNPDLLQRATRMDFANYLPEDILVKVDRASMLNSLEVRAPFLDYRLIEFAFRKVPSHLKATHTDNKILLKRLTERVLPPKFDRQRKQGLSIPLAEWLKVGSFQEMFDSVLLDSSCIFDHSTVHGLLRGQARGRSNDERLFALVLFELWRKEYSVTL
jgi:asparagine synthase (glutamine-hydrolysing)